MVPLPAGQTEVAVALAVALVEVAEEEKLAKDPITKD